MKTSFYFIFNLFLFVFISFSSLAQISTAFTYADGYNACGESNLKITLKNISPADSIQVFAEFQLNSAMQVLAFSTSQPNNEILTSVMGNNLQVFFKKSLKATRSYELNIRMKSSKSCAQIACGQFFATRDTLTLTYNSRDYFFYNNNILASPCLTYDETLFKNRLTTAFLGDTITRRIVLKNTGGGKFNGAVQVKDVFGPFVRVDTIYSNTPGYTITSSLRTNDSTYVFNGQFANIRNGDSVVFIEKVVVTKCIKDNEGKSSIFINWSCGNGLCNTTDPYPIIAQVIKNKKKPDVIITKSLIPESNCLNSKTTYRYKIKNQGPRPATDLRFMLSAVDYNTYTYIHKASLVIKDTLGLQLVPTSYSQQTLSYDDRKLVTVDHSCRIADPLYKWEFGFQSLMPGDSFVVEAEGFHCCPGDDTSNVDVVFETWNLGVKYKDECKEEEFSANSGTEVLNVLSVQQFYEPIITDMAENQIQTFEIFNNGFATTFYRFNEQSAAFKVRLKLDTGLVYVPQTIAITSIFGYTLKATSEQLVLGAGVEGYADPYLEAVFVLPDTFRIDKTFFARFMRNSSVVFDLQAICPAREPSSRFTQDFFAIPDLSCAQACEILLGSFTTLINVHCPGCITPGWVSNSHSAIRLNLGEQDNDNNRLPDNLTYVPADRSKIKNNRCLPGDTLQTTLTAYFQDGDPFTGQSTSQLENRALDPFHFRYSYLSSKITMGKLFQLNSVKVFVTDLDKAAITAGLDSIALPLSCVSKVPNVNDSLSDAEFFFDLSLDTLYKYGIDPRYEYDPGDGLKIVCNYTILEPSSLYLSTPPTTRDPWLLRENAPLLLNAFQNLVYLTGNRNTVNDRIRADAGSSFDGNSNSLDSTMIYWCEGYGSASTLVGKRKEVVFSLPNTIQCQDRASFSVSLTPSGGVFRNVFPFEYRKLIIIDSVQTSVPLGYHYSDWTITNTIQKPDGFLEYEPCTRTDTLKNIIVNGSLMTVYIDPLYSRQRLFGTDVCTDKLVYGDENVKTEISYRIVPDCDLPENNPIVYPSPVLHYRVGPNKIPYHDRPVSEYCLPLPFDDICRFYPVLTSLSKVNAELKVSPVTNETQLSQQTFCYPISLEEKIGYNAQFSFLKIKSLNNKVKAVKLTHTETNRVYLPDAKGVFHLDTTAGKSVNLYELCFSNICGKLIEKDTVRLLYGHDCFAYPDSVYANICKLDSIEHYVFPGNLAVFGFVNGPAEIKMCETFEVTTNYQITGLGGVENMLIALNKDSASLVAAKLTINDDPALSTDIFTAAQASSGRFDLKQKILSVKPAGLKAGDKVTVVLKFNTDCTYKGAAISSQVLLTTSACDTLYGETLQYIPPALIGYPIPDKKTIQTSYGALKNLGGKVELTLNVMNQAAVVTKNKTRVTLLLPVGFTYANMASGNAPSRTTDTSIVWDMEPGLAAARAVTFKPLLNYKAVTCDSIVFKYLLSDVSIGCSSQPCVQKDTAYRFKVPVTCYPCPAAITLSERCKEVPVFNVISWEYPTANYCPDDTLFIYKLYFSPTGNGDYILLDSTRNKTYTHDSLERYDGCYYVTVTDLQQQLTTTSEVACKATCREQFECGDLFIPNLLTPNKDGNNDAFQITGAYTSLKVEIYNSWGSTVFKSDNYKNEWDAKGLADGVYYYHVYIDGSDKKCLGWIHVLGGK
jgi:gliding motility-associated-like protein